MLLYVMYNPPTISSSCITDYHYKKIIKNNIVIRINNTNNDDNTLSKFTLAFYKMFWKYI